MSVNMVVLQIQITFLMLVWCMHVLVKVYQSIFILICCNKESTKFFLFNMWEYNSDFLSINITILVLVKRYEVILVLVFLILLFLCLWCTIRKLIWLSFGYLGLLPLWSWAETKVTRSTPAMNTKWVNFI
jgi:hypothetical protein